MAEKKRKTLKPKVLKDGTQVYGSPEEWSKSSASGPVDSKFWGQKAGWSAAMEAEYGDDGGDYSSLRKKNVKRAKDSQAREKARGMMGGGKVKGYKGGGCVMPGRGGSYKGMR